VRTTQPTRRETLDAMNLQRIQIAALAAVAAAALAVPSGASASILAGSPAMPWDTFMKDEAATAAAVGSASTKPGELKDEAAIAAAVGPAHAGDQAVIAATIRGMALNQQLHALNSQNETHTQFVGWMNAV
jgi:hypothetical protein